MQPLNGQNGDGNEKWIGAEAAVREFKGFLSTEFTMSTVPPFKQHSRPSCCDHLSVLKSLSL